MRLNPFNPGSINVRRGGSGGGGMPGGKLGCGGIAIVVIAALVFGVDPAQMLGTMEQMNAGAAQQPAYSSESAMEICDDNQYSMETCNALGSLNQTWARRFQEAGVGNRFQQPTLTFIEGNSVNSGCGTASAGVGPFYCPADQGIYIHTGFYDQLAQMAGNGGDFARLYVVAHEYGHHIQNISGLAGQIRSAQQQNPRASNQLQVRMELHADCLAGVWAGRNRNLIEPGDFEEGMEAAAAIGDDRLTGGRVSSENFTHGTSRQRMEALRMGMETGDDNRCTNTYFQA
ncbi:neutral zinc metallopeptidase [Aurantiacibacter sp. MUD11]|uniref:KPN_02809 family neutral zinc metallopeptidase n=1 Tax=Aurantiacibacter sp. MUD11 TaxID=3003265 RepID=UPI0022AAB130|nr:neutral zinc metallopeptidase [Aurantiacibacter sp. MUD11]WAT18158.1 neutral zinc metallopeptidase [Aurantiacibacter sp. MUD11]